MLFGQNSQIKNLDSPGNLSGCTGQGAAFVFRVQDLWADIQCGVHTDDGTGPKKQNKQE